LKVQRDEDDEEEQPNVDEMVEFLEGIEEPLDSEPLRDCIEDLRSLGELTANLPEQVEAVDGLLAELIDQLEEELDQEADRESRASREP
jgi:hypothetical protein